MAKEKESYSADITQRFLLISDEVIQAGLCKSKAEFAKAVGEYPQNLSLMEKGTRSPTLDQIVKACTEYEYSANWLILNIGPKKLDKKQEIPLEKRVSDLETQMRSLKRKVNQV